MESEFVTIDSSGIYIGEAVGRVKIPAAFVEVKIQNVNLYQRKDFVVIVPGIQLAKAFAQVVKGTICPEGLTEYLELQMNLLLVI